METLSETLVSEFMEDTLKQLLQLCRKWYFLQCYQQKVHVFQFKQDAKVGSQYLLIPHFYLFLCVWGGDEKKHQYGNVIVFNQYHCYIVNLTF